MDLAFRKLGLDRAIQAEELRSQRDATRLAQLNVDLAELHGLAGDGQASRRIGEQAIGLAKECGDAELQARAVLAFGGDFPITQMGRVDQKMIGYLDSALDALRDLRDRTTDDEIRGLIDAGMRMLDG